MRYLQEHADAETLWCTRIPRETVWQCSCGMEHAGDTEAWDCRNCRRVYSDEARLYRHVWEIH